MREYPAAPDLGYASSTRPSKGINTAPPRNGKRFNVPTEVPAISMGKSSLVVVKATKTIAEEHRVKKRKTQY